MEAAPGFNPMLTANLGKAGAWKLESYQQTGGYEQWRRALAGGITREAIVDEVKKSGIRGRGGAGFPMAMKWGTLPPAPPIRESSP